MAPPSLSLSTSRKRKTLFKRELEGRGVPSVDFSRSVADFNKRLRRRDSVRQLKRAFSAVRVAEAAEATQAAAAVVADKDQMEKELENKLDVELKVREGTRRLLNACRGKAQLLEAAKSLKTSNERVSALMAELQSRRQKALVANSSPKLDKEGNDVNGSKNGEKPRSRARVSLSEIRIPLIWKEVDHFKNKGDHRKFAVFCLAKIGPEIYDTGLVNPVDRSCTDVSFDDVMIFNNIPPDFSCTMEIYSHVVQEETSSIASTPRKLKKSFHSSISKTVGKKLALSLKDELSEGSVGPKFHLVATGTMSLEDAGSEMQTIDLRLESDMDSNGNGLQSSNSSHAHPQPHDLPLFGHFCCRMAVVPDSSRSKKMPGRVKVKRVRDRSGREEEGEVEECRGEVVNFRLTLWGCQSGAEVDDGDEEEDGPRFQIPLSSDTEIAKGEKTEDGQIIEIEYGLERLEITNPSSDDYAEWMKSLETTKKESALWKGAADHPMEIASHSPNRYCFNRYARLRSGSLYDETCLQDTPPNPSKPVPPTHESDEEEGADSSVASKDAASTSSSIMPPPPVPSAPSANNLTWDSKEWKLSAPPAVGTASSLSSSSSGSSGAAAAPVAALSSSSSTSSSSSSSASTENVLFRGRSNSAANASATTSGNIRSALSHFSVLRGFNTR